ncbi:hypothetical protein PAECIP112173_00822 [Paenibacillus sp. JJ-100]|uniref:GNAT family N-acetyltransferase n=1 Tax=Paenibacillus sp. JJ-100 TaxID=2974896 RepID=UPI0022FFB7D2|nr:GNAT family N-acetyltransferase [Paenibacillus sp. JJ-100]CAI6036013.1 hypothetical protein PAECIP112173_00822 [Paenibacillus sp. JJ-100]
MEITLVKSGLDGAHAIYEMQKKSFTPLLKKYQDFETSPANQTVAQVTARLSQSFTDYYIIKCSEMSVGAIRIVKKENKIYRISPIFILPEFQGRGIAQNVFSIVEDLYCDAIMWELDTVLQEQRNCYLYEKLGYKRTNRIKEINDKMTIVSYEKHMKHS